MEMTVKLPMGWLLAALIGVCLLCFGFQHYEVRAAPLHYPKVIVAISGKRKTGKDYFYDLLMQQLFKIAPYESISTRRFATPIKLHFAQMAGIDVQSLETSGPLKERFRESFYEYDLAERAKDPYVFARASLQDILTDIIVISDLRQLGDYDFLQRFYGDRLVLIRLDASEHLRSTRGYRFTTGVDDTAVECDLDDDRITVPWTLRFVNDGDDTKWPARLHQVMEKIKPFLA